MSAATITVPEITSVEQARDVVSHLFNKLKESVWRIVQLEKQLYGPSSERKAGESNLSKEQVLLSLFAAPAEAPATSQVLVAATEDKEPRARRQFAIKTVETVTERLEPEEKVCPHCGKQKCEIGCEKSERYEYIPAKVVRHEIIRPKLACQCGLAGVSIAPLPPVLVAQGSADSSLVAQVLLAKFVDHLPLYRQQQIFARLGVNLPKSTLGDWVTHGASWLLAAMRAHFLFRFQPLRHRLDCLNRKLPARTGLFLLSCGHQHLAGGRRFGRCSKERKQHLFFG